jgi:acetyl esterase/lipase
MSDALVSRRTLLTLSGAMAAAACSPLAPLNWTAGTSARRRVDVAYGSLPRQRLDLYAPAAGTTGAPLVVFFYGGSWTGGDRASYRFVGEALAAIGCAVAIPDYRVHPSVRYPTFLEDCAASVAWLRQHADTVGIDAGRTVLAGHSAGAYNAAMLALDPRWLGAAGAERADVRGWIGLCGPYDFLPPRSATLRAIFGPPAGWPDTQPVTHVTPGAPPALLLWGDDDSTVLPRNSERLATRLRAAGNDVTTEAYRGVGHVKPLLALSRPFRDALPVLPAMDAFVRRVTASTGRRAS